MKKLKARAKEIQNVIQAAQQTSTEEIEAETFEASPLPDLY